MGVMSVRSDGMGKCLRLISVGNSMQTPPASDERQGNFAVLSRVISSGVYRNENIDILVNAKISLTIRERPPGSLVEKCVKRPSPPAPTLHVSIDPTLPPAWGLSFFGSQEPYLQLSSRSVWVV